MKTKFSKTIDTTFFPVDPSYLKCFTAWVDYLRTEKLFCPQDGLFPKQDNGHVKGKGFGVLGLARDTYSNGGLLNKIIRNAFAMVQMPEYTPHSFRTTLAMYGVDACVGNMEKLKAWSMNLAHENMMTTVTSYMPVSRERRAELIAGMQKERAK